MIMKPEWSLLTILIPTIADGMRHLHWEICHIFRIMESDIEYLLGDGADINHVLMLTDAFSYDMILEIGPYEKFGSHELTQSYLRDMGFEVFIPESSEISQRYSTFGDYAEAWTERNTAKIWIYDQNGELVTEREFLIEE